MMENSSWRGLALSPPKPGGDKSSSLSSCTSSISFSATALPLPNSSNSAINNTINTSSKTTSSSGSGSPSSVGIHLNSISSNTSSFSLEEENGALHKNPSLTTKACSVKLVDISLQPTTAPSTHSSTPEITTSTSTSISSSPLKRESPSPSSSLYEYPFKKVKTPLPSTTTAAATIITATPEGSASTNHPSVSRVSISPLKDSSPPSSPKANTSVTITKLTPEPGKKVRRRPSPDEGSSLRCSKCREVFSTKEAKRLHTCNSILDQHFLIESGDRLKPENHSKEDFSSASNSPTMHPLHTKPDSRVPSPTNSLPKLKLETKRDKWIASPGGGSTPHHLDNNGCLGSQNSKGGGCSGGFLPPERTPPSSENSQDSNSANFTGKIRIKYGGSSEDTIPQSKQGNQDGYAYAFTGRPSYSPSRIESNGPGGNVQDKESPRDASNKDSPASQADSGVFSIASSNSPSKGDVHSVADGTSPDSPNNRERLNYSDQVFNRDLQWKSSSSGVHSSFSSSSSSGSDSCNLRNNSLAPIAGPPPSNVSSSSPMTSCVDNIPVMTTSSSPSPMMMSNPSPASSILSNENNPSSMNQDPQHIQQQQNMRMRQQHQSTMNHQQALQQQVSAASARSQSQSVAMPPQQGTPQARTQQHSVQQQMQNRINFSQMQQHHQPQQQPYNNPYQMGAMGIPNQQTQHQEQQQQQRQVQQQQQIRDSNLYGGQLPQDPRQFSFAQNYFNFNAEPPAAKRKRGRPRKNPSKDPNAPKRSYSRKKKGTDEGGGGGVIGGGGVGVSGNNNSVYNFEEEEDDDIYKMKQDSNSANSVNNTLATRKKISFGSSSDEDSVNKVAAAAAAAVASNNIVGHHPHHRLPGGGPMGYHQGMMPQHTRNYMQQHQGYHPQMQQQQQILNQQQQQQQQHHQQMQQMMQQQQHQTMGNNMHRQQQISIQQQQHRAMSVNNNYNRPSSTHGGNPSTDEPMYSSEILKTGTGIGIKIKIKTKKNQESEGAKKRKVDPNGNTTTAAPTNNTNSTVMSSNHIHHHQQQQQQQHIHHHPHNHLQHQHHHQQQQSSLISKPSTVTSSSLQQQHQQQGNSSAPSLPSSTYTPSVSLTSQLSMSQQMQIPRPSNPSGPSAQHMIPQHIQSQLQQQTPKCSVSSPSPTQQQQHAARFKSQMQQRPGGPVSPAGMRPQSPYVSPHGSSPTFSGNSTTNNNNNSNVNPSNNNSTNNSINNPFKMNGPTNNGMNNYYQHRINSPFHEQQSAQQQFYHQGGYNNYNQGNSHRFSAGIQQQQQYYNQQQQQQYNQQQQATTAFDYNSQQQVQGGMFQGGNGAYGNSSNMYMNASAGQGGIQSNSSPMHHSNNMHMPMPGVGLPRVSPSLGGQSRSSATPLVSPSPSDHSPASNHNPLTPASNYGPTTPQSCGRPQTPQHSQTPSVVPPAPLASPITPVGPKTPQSVGFPLSNNPPSSSAANTPLPSLGKQQPSPLSNESDLKSPLANMKSPSGGTSSNLRKIRRPSKQKEEEGPLSNKESTYSTSLQNSPAAPVKTFTPSSPAIKSELDLPLKTTSPPHPTHTETPGGVKKEIKSPKSPKHDVIKEEIKEEVEKSGFVARWADLDNKILKKIFSYGIVKDGSSFMVRVSRVCSSWFKAAIDPDIWTHLDFSAGKLKEKYRNDKKLEIFLKKFPNVRELKCGNWRNSVSSSTLKIIAANCPKIVSLSFNGCFKLTNEDLKFIGDNFEHLERLDLSSVSPSSGSSRSAVSSTCLSEFITVLGKRLTYLNISNNKMAGLPFVFKALSSNSSNLRELDISNITTTSRDTILINMEKFQKGCPLLRALNCNHTMISLSETPIKEQVHSPGFPLLERLQIAVDSRGYFEGMDDSQIERILKKSDRLRHLDIRGCQRVSDSCLIRLPTWDIEHLILSGCSAASASADGLELMVRKWADKLVEMDVSNTPGERAVNYTVEAFVEADKTNIRKLNLSCTAVSLKPLTRLLKNCPSIEYLNLSSCRGLARGMKRLYQTRPDIIKLRTEIIDGKFNDNDDSDD
uniref:F-box domain-containing protein n=1 Tax=Lepeophtheirus salmonis TaxID=72036 RepID=A0A0K2TVP2_LEPSM